MSSMNSMRGAVPFEADGESLYLRLATNAQVRYEDAAGETVTEAFIGLLSVADPDPAATPAKQLERERGLNKRLRRLFWAGLSHMPGMSEDRAGDILDAIGRTEACTLLGEAIKLAMPELVAQGEPEGNAPEAAKKAARTKPAKAQETAS